MLIKDIGAKGAGRYNMEVVSSVPIGGLGLPQPALAEVSILDVVTMGISVRLGLDWCFRPIGRLAFMFWFWSLSRGICSFWLNIV